MELRFQERKAAVKFVFRVDLIGAKSSEPPRNFSRPNLEYKDKGCMIMFLLAPVFMIDCEMRMLTSKGSCTANPIMNQKTDLLD